MRRFLPVLFMMLAGLPARSQQVALDPNLPYQGAKSNPITYEVDFSAVVTPPYQCQMLKVWLPIPPSDACQQVSNSELSSFPMAVKPKVGTESKYGNQFAYFEFARPKGAQIIRHQFKVKVYEMRWHLDPAKAQPVKQWPTAFDPYLKGESQSVVIDGRVQQLAKQVVPSPANPAEDLSAVMSWVNGRMTYDHVIASLQASSQHALNKERGHCSDYHGLCASLGRALGYPTRVAYGLNAFPRNSPSHCKLEAFIPPYGWVPFDVSETQKIITAIQADATLDAQKKEELLVAVNAHLFRGFRDNTWFLQTRGSDYDLAPPAAKRVPVVRTIHAEADGVALPDPDPGNKEKREFAWMTIHHYKADREVVYPFKDYQTLLSK